MNFDIAIIGGGVIGMEFASFFNSMGSKGACGRNDAGDCLFEYESSGSE